MILAPRLRRAGALAACLASTALLGGCLGSWSVAGLKAKRGQGLSRDYQASHDEVLAIAKEQVLSTPWEGKGSDDQGAYAWFSDLFGGAGEAIFVDPTTAQGVTKAEAFFSSFGVDGGAMEQAFLNSIETALHNRRSTEAGQAPAETPTAAAAPKTKQWWEK